MASHRSKGMSKNRVTFSYFHIISISLYFLLFSYLVVASELDPSRISNSVTGACNENNEIPCRENVIEQENSSFDNVLMRKQQEQLEKLEEVVKNLNELVSRLESRFLGSPGSSKMSPFSSSHGEVGDHVDITKNIEVSDSKMGAGASIVTKYSTFWSEKFHFISAVRLSSIPTCINVLPFRDFEGLSKYFAIGDSLGKVYVFYRSGDVSLEFNTFLEPEESSPITTIVSYLSVNKNETIIITGHENGVIAMHRVWEVPTGDESSLLNVEKVGQFELPGGHKSGINLLTVHSVGRKRYILATNADGKIIVFREDGSLHGTASPNSRPVLFLRQRLMFLTENGGGFLDLRTMKIKESECEGLNSSLVKSYVFDVSDRSKAYGTTSEGELIQTLLFGDTITFKCRIRSKRKLDLDEPLSLQAIKGYLLIANKDKVSVYNISSQRYVGAGGLRHSFSTEVDEILSSFLQKKEVSAGDGKGTTLPLIASDYDKHVIITLGEGYVAMFRSNLPVFKNEFNSLLWTSPVLFFVLFLFGAWHFFANKKEALTSWGPDVPFSTSSTVTNGATQLSSNNNTGERSSNDNLRRYVSPPRYPGGGAGNAYGSGPDPDHRPFGVENRFRTGSELKFRAPSGDQRREGLFANSKVVGDEAK